MRTVAIFIAALCQSLLTCDADPNANLSVDLQSRFPSDSITHQAAEYYASVSPLLFWSSLEHLSTLSTANVSRTDRDLYDSIIACIDLSSSEACSTLKMSLGLNVYSPLLESNRQLLRDAIKGSASKLEPDSCKSGVIVDYGNKQLSCGFDPKLLQTDAMLETFEFDHMHPNRTTGAALVVYGNLDQPGFADSYQKIVSCKQPFRFILRLSSFNLGASDSFPLNGFGVELAFKNMEYNVLDDTNLQADSSSVNGINFSRLKTRYPSSSEQLDDIAVKLRHELQEELRVWDIADFGSQAVQYVLDSKDTLSELARLACDFPRHATKLKTVQVSKEVRSQISTIHESSDIVTGESSLYLNGIAIDTSEFDLFALHSLAAKESKYIEMLSNIGLNSFQIDNALQNASRPLKSKRTAVYPSAAGAKPRLDTRSDSISWMNDIETGSKYRSWHRSLSTMRLYPGQFSLLQIGRNLYNCVAVIDPSKRSGLQLVEQLKQLVKQQAPVRVGIVFDANRPERGRFGDFKSIHEDISENQTQITKLNPVASLTARLFSWALAKSRRRAFSFLSALLQIQETVTSEDVSIDRVKKAFLAKNGASGDIETYNALFSVTDTENEFVSDCINYVTERNIATVDTIFFNGVQQEVPHPQLLLQTLIRATYTWQTRIMHAVHSGSLSDDDDISSYIFDGSDVVKSYSDLLQQPKDQWKYTSDMAVDLLYVQPQNLQYLTGPHTEPANITIWVYADLSTVEGASLALSALRHLQSPAGSGKRLAFVTYGSSADSGFTANSLVMDLVRKIQEPLDAVSKIIKLLCLRLSENSETFRKRVISWGAEDPDVLTASSSTWGPQLLTNVEGPSLIVNGRVIEVTRPMVQSEFKLLDQLAFELSDDLKNDVEKYMLTTACLGARMRGIEFLRNFDSMISASKRYASSSHFKVVAVISPLSEVCQLLTSVLLGLRDKLNWDLTLIFNPPSVTSSLPIKRYYRYVFEPELRFESDGTIDLSNVKADFVLPSKTPVLTLSVETTEPWLVESSYAEIDLDNMQLYPGMDQQRVTFDLKNLLVYGTCLELSPNPSPPAGLKILLESSDKHYDTIVMENLGYFQLKSTPNVFDLKLAPGKATEMFMFPDNQQLPIHSADLIYQSNRVRVPVRSFTRSHLQLFLVRRPGMEMRSLLELTEPDASPSRISGFWNSLFRNESGDKETIHIFSIASGHLYERFLRIMMLSVAKRMSSTNYKIKFWFVGQFLSPQFKTNINSFAEQHGFSVELVTYKWPSWLRRQREKQRTIWGYKILFLDVLFPINLDRIIFIDADQIVRGDLSELWNLDLNGNPYAYTPFCDSNTLTEGFRFWKGGFWKEHLRGRQYHISALYVVDLKQFRKIRAGDTLRAMYDNLSADPNSLANLDQDLPNYAQHVVGIYSLPQEWLWCETWCSMESLNEAKTIDLCNNPMTKEPKLSRARRLLPEWNALNEEANLVSRNATESPASNAEVASEKTEL